MDNNQQIKELYVKLNKIAWSYHNMTISPLRIESDMKECQKEIDALKNSK